MMRITEGNEIIRDVIYKNITSFNQILKTIDEFAYYKYRISSSYNNEGNSAYNM